MTTETHTVAMTDPQLTNNTNNNNNNNNNNTSNNNNNNDGEPKYLHKKFKKMATTEVAAKVEPKKDSTGVSNSVEKKKESPKEQPLKAEASPEPEGESTESRKSGYVCPYCKLSCAKPSVLQKHIRAHTNERPYPCVLCGFAFKTKSNLYKHCRSRAHALKMEGGDASKVSEDSDISLSDSASNGTGTPPPPPASTPTSSTTVSTVKTIKTGKIYKPKFHTALQCVTNETETSSLSSGSSSNGSSGATTKPNVDQVQEHIDKIITDNQAIVDAVDPRLQKLMQRQQSLIETKSDQPLNLSAEERTARKRCYSETFGQEAGQTDGSIIKDLLLKPQGSQEESYVCPSCSIPYSSVENLEAHRRYYCKGRAASPADYTEVDKREPEFDPKADYYSTLQPLPSPGPLLGNTRLVDAYAPPVKKQRPDSVPTTTLRSLEELSKYPRPNSLQMFGGEVRILDNTGETKTMRIEPRQTNSPTSEHIVSSKCVTSETASIVVRSGLHSGGTMVHKPPATVANSTSSSTISLANTPKILAPLIPNISTPSIAPTMSCYNYLETQLSPLTSITAYNPLTLTQPGITSILHGGKVIPYVPGMPGPHTLTGSIDISPSVGPGEAGYKVIPGLPGLHMIQQPLDLASPVKVQPPAVPGIPGPISSSHVLIGQPLDLASPAKESKMNFKAPSSDSVKGGSLVSPKVGVKMETSSENKYRRPPTTPIGEITKAELDRHIKNNAVKYKGVESRREFSYERSPKLEKLTFTYPNGVNTISSSNLNSSSLNSPNLTSSSSHSKLRTKESIETRKRPSTWPISELESPRSQIDPVGPNSASKYESPPSPHENGRLKTNSSIEIRSKDSYGPFNGKIKPDSVQTSVILVNLDCSKAEVSKSSSESVVKADKVDSKSPSREETSTSKFLRPTSLPLKPGTFTPKKHHGITPTANTLPLISPETPRPKKSYGQLYLNGHAYTYLGLKCSTRLFYCTLNRPQPMYVTQQHGLSMYSNWKICKEAPPDLDMAHYDSRHRPLNYTTAWRKQEDILTHSSQRPTTPSSPDSGLDSDMQEKAKRVKIFDGGFESNEDYTYVRGRGRGRYVCEECGIRCKKPSMLKKHIRTHTDVRPYTCKHCAFSFKTKGNLTKHMKSKAHYKKCVELGVVPVPTSVCDENIDKEAIAKLAAGGNTEDSSSEEEESDGEDSEESGSEEQEAAQSLLSLSQRNSTRLPGLLPAGRPTTYPYTLTLPSTTASGSVVSSSSSLSIGDQTVVSSATVMQNELSNRYYFPSSRTSEEVRSSVIQSSRKEESDLEAEELNEDSRQLSQPMDLTTKQPAQLPSPATTPGQRARPADILTPVSEPVLLQTIVQTMERLPIQGREWKPDAEGQMLQAYLTERHVMDSRIKQQYRVGSTKIDKQLKEKDIYAKPPHSPISRSIEANCPPSVGYTDSAKTQQTVVDSRVKHMTRQDDVKMEIREKIYQNNNAERRSFDFESIHRHKDQNNYEQCLSSPINSSKTEYAPSKSSNCVDRSSFESPSRSTPGLDAHSPKPFSVEANNRVCSETERSYGPMKIISEIERPREYHTVNQEVRTVQSQSPRVDLLRPPSREVRGQEYRPPEYKLPRQELRPQSQEIRVPSQEFKEVIGPSLEVNRPPSRDMVLLSDYRHPQDSRPGSLIQLPGIQEPRSSQTVDVRPAEMKHAADITKQSIAESIKHTVARKMVVGGPGFRSPSPTAPGNNVKPQAEFLQPSSGPAPNYVSYSVTEDGRSVCGVCNKVFSKPSQLRLHINIHYFERPFRCESCAVSFRTKGHLTKHERSVSHHNKVSMTSTFGAATTSNPRPFKCTDCKIAFRIHGHLAKHLRSKMHIMKLECLGKLPFGTYAEMERSGVNLNDIDTTDCDNSLTSLQILAQRLCEKDPSKIGHWDTEAMVPSQGVSGGETSSDEGEPIPQHGIYQNVPIGLSEDTKPSSEASRPTNQSGQPRHDQNSKDRPKGQSSASFQPEEPIRPED